jgi:predicted ATPase
MIKARFKNIGPIKDAELELGDFTIIAGQNNTGKTYLTYTLYGFLDFIISSPLRRVHFINFHVVRRNRAIKKGIDQIVDDILKLGKAEIPLDKYKELQAQFIEAFSKYFSSDVLYEIFSSPDSEYEEASFDAHIDYEKRTLGKEEFARLFEPMDVLWEGEKLILEPNTAKKDRIRDRYLGLEVIRVLILLLRRDIPKPLILSAERFGISLFYKELDFKRNRLVEELQRLSDNTDNKREKKYNLFRFLSEESARYAKPIQDNINFIRDLSRLQKKRSKLTISPNRSVEKMMGGRYNAKDDDIRFISKKSKDKGFNIPLHLASSSARGVLDLHYRLKHAAKQGQLLIIDEPESHLSPTNQMQMARLLVFCVNTGLKVLITTHSDYLIKEINNLIMLSNNFDGKDKFLKKHKDIYKKDDFLRPDSVKAYTCESGTLKPCNVDETGIDMPIFDDAINKMNKISTELGYKLSLGNPEDD